MSKSINVIYFVDKTDNTKSPICAVTNDKDLRDIDFVANLTEELKNTFAHNSLTTIVAHSIALSIAHHKYAEMKEYQFGVEEIPLFD